MGSTKDSSRKSMKDINPLFSIHPALDCFCQNAVSVAFPTSVTEKVCARKARIQAKTLPNKPDQYAKR